MSTRIGSDGLPYERPWWRDWVVGAIGSILGGLLGSGVVLIVRAIA